MTTIDNTYGADLIAKYAKTTGNGLEKSRADIIRMISTSLNADVTDAFSVAHVGVARLIKEIGEDISDPDKACDSVFTSITLIMSVCAIMQAQHSINEFDKEIGGGLLKTAPESIRKKGVLLAASMPIKQRSTELAQMVDAIVHLFMGNVVTSVVGR